MSIDNILCVMLSDPLDTVLTCNRYQEANAKFEEELRERDGRYAEMTNALAKMSAQEREKELLSQVHIAEERSFLYRFVIEAHTPSNTFCSSRSY